MRLTKHMVNRGMNRISRSLLSAGILIAVVVLVMAAYRFLWRGEREPLIVYCAHDSIYSEKILRGFEERTGIRVLPRFDTEATKSLGLVELLIRERNNPRCDVFWNNELLGTMDLQERGLLTPYKGSGFERMPPAFRDPDGYWAGFGGRMRVLIVNTEKIAATREAVEKVLSGSLARVAIAKPLYGTTLTHYSVLWHLWGGNKLKGWHEQLRAAGIREVLGNATVKNLVAEGVCDLGFTDSDDFFQAKDEGKPVAMLPVRLENDAVICIPNTVSIIKGTRREADARKLVDYLLSESCELALAGGKSRQVPLGAVDEALLSEEVRELKQWVRDGYSLTGLGAARGSCILWLKSEYAGTKGEEE